MWYVCTKGKLYAETDMHGGKTKRKREKHHVAMKAGMGMMHLLTKECRRCWVTPPWLGARPVPG